MAVDSKRQGADLVVFVKTALQAFGIEDAQIRDMHEEFMQRLLEAFMKGAGQPLWNGRTDARYIFLWNSTTPEPVPS